MTRAPAATEEEQRFAAARWAARVTTVLFLAAWLSILTFSFVWDCGAACQLRYGRVLASTAVSAMLLFATGALVLAASMRVRLHLKRGPINGLNSIVDRLLAVTAVFACLLMVCAFLLGAFANAGAMEDLTLWPWVTSSLVSALVMAVFSAVVGGGSWRAGLRGSRPTGDSE